MSHNQFARPLVLAAAAAALCATVSFAAPVEFPPLPNGVREIREEGDVAPYLAAWKANAMARTRAMAQPATANQQQYDARWYDVNVTYSGTATISGIARMQATVVGGPLTTVDLDFYSNMVVDAATAAGLPTTYSRAGNILTLNLDRAYIDGETFDVQVTYHGNPTAAGYFGVQTVNARTLVWSLSEAYGARTWWPCKDAPEDKADSVDVHFTAPSNMITASNGTLVSRFVNAGTATTNYHERHPIATYLVSIASYPYTVTDDWYRPTPTDSMLIRFHNYPESVASVSAVQAKVKNMLAAFASRFGEYPFVDEKYGHAQFQFGGGMEHQTCTSIGAFSESVVAHELMHQWWGDMVTCRDFHHIWLNEGFATYGEAVWLESLGGLPAYQNEMMLSRYLGAGTIWVPDATNENRVFDSNLSYNKASWVLHMLRHMLGDVAFFQAMRDYRATWQYNSATTEDFRDAIEASSGRELDDFFQQWIYGEYYPVYHSSWTVAEDDTAGWNVTVTLEQVQSWQLFHMPVDITITTGSGDVTFVVDDPAVASQQFVLHVSDLPTGIAIDKDNWILKGADPIVTNPSFERSVLLVNGVDWANYGAEIVNAYNSQAFWGTYPIHFWDIFPTPAGGYPGTLPAPLGHGTPPGSLLAHYRNVIWIGNNFTGDLASWQDTPILSYLKVGGNVLLMSRQGNQFLNDSLRTYLGINWTNIDATLNDCLATRPGFSNMTPISSQTLCAAFDTVRTTPESHLLFRASSGFSPTRGLGAIRIPTNGAGNRPKGGRFAFVSGRPYRWNATQLKGNVMQILSAWFNEQPGGLAVDDSPRSPLELSARPNPSTSNSTLRYSVPRAGRVSLVLLDVQGRRVRTLVDGAVGPGAHEVAWNGRGDHGDRVAAGIYWAMVETGGERKVTRLVRLD